MVNGSTNPYGKTPEQQADIERYVREVEPLFRRGATVRLDGRRRVSELADVVEHPPHRNFLICPESHVWRCGLQADQAAQELSAAEAVGYVARETMEEVRGQPREAGNPIEASTSGSAQMMPASSSLVAATRDIRFWPLSGLTP